MGRRGSTGPFADRGRRRSARRRVRRLMRRGWPRGPVPRSACERPRSPTPTPRRPRTSSSATSDPASKLDRRYVGDITYIATWEGWAYLATVIDLASRRVVGWALADHMRTDLVADALQMAFVHQPTRPEGVIFHSDRGCQYTSGTSPQLARANGVVLSVGRKGECWDNAVAEIVLRDHQARAHRHALMADASRTSPRRLRVHRGLVQHAALAQLARLPAAPPNTKHSSTTTPSVRRHDQHNQPVRLHRQLLERSRESPHTWPCLILRRGVGFLIGTNDPLMIWAASIGTKGPHGCCRPGGRWNNSPVFAVGWLPRPLGRVASLGQDGHVGRRRPVQVRRLDRASLRSICARPELARRWPRWARSLIWDSRLLPPDGMRSGYVYGCAGVRTVGARRPRGRRAGR